MRLPPCADFAGFSLGSGSIPDETAILNFRHLLEANKLTEHIFALINQHLLSKGLRLSKGTIVDAKIIEGPSSRVRRRMPPVRETLRCTRPKRATTEPDRFFETG